MMARLVPRVKPSEAKPHAIKRTSSAVCAQLVVCQMPRCFSRKAGCVGRICACCNNSRGKVSADMGSVSAMVVLFILNLKCRCFACDFQSAYSATEVLFIGLSEAVPCTT